MHDVALALQPVQTASTGPGSDITVVRTRRGTITIAPLCDGDTQAVEAVFERLSVRARRQRFGKSELLPREFALHASVGAGRHALIARAGRRAVALAHLVRDQDPSSAEVAVAVADEWHGIGIGSALARRLTADAARTGITRVHALISADNEASLALMRSATTIVSTRLEGAEIHMVGASRPQRPRRFNSTADAPVRSCSGCGGRCRSQPHAPLAIDQY